MRYAPVPQTVHPQRFAWNPEAQLYGLASPQTPAATASQINDHVRRFADDGDLPLTFVSDLIAPEALLRAFALVAMGRAFCLSEPDRGHQQAMTGSSQLTVGATTDPTFQTMTSGTTDAPRRIRRTHRSWISSFEQNAALWGIGRSDRTAVLGRLAHSLSLYASLEALHLGADLHLLTGGRPDRQFLELERRQVTILYATPAQLRMLDEARRRMGEPPAPALRLLIIGGSKMDRATRAAATEMFPAAALHEFYGASETSFITLSDRDAPPESVGRAYPQVEIEIRNEAGTAIGLGSTGEIWVRSPYLFSGYASGASGDTRWRGDFLTIGEVGRLDSSGFLYLSGRKSRMTTIADQNVFLEEIESVLLCQAGVEQAAVLAVADPKRGAILIAFVRLAPAAPSVDRIATACRAAVGSLKAPRRVIPLQHWPLLPSGKTDLDALRAYLDPGSS